MARVFKASGPGVLFASTAIGVSHLVQSTRAGADFGLLILGFVVLAIVLKYPFFEYGTRYAGSTQTSIIDGYGHIGRPALWTYFLLTVASMFFVTGAVGFVTAGFLKNLFGASFLGDWTLVILLGVSITILALGKYGLLDGMIKVIVAILGISTIVAFVLVLNHGPIEPVPEFEPRELWNASGIFFLLALMGWMPSSIDLSSWNSLWTLERIKQMRHKPRLQDMLLEFRLMYLLTGILAVMFVTLGAFIIYGSGEEMPNNNNLFAHEVVMLYTETIGEWSHLIIAASAFTAMFGTIIAVLDGYSRSLQKSIELIFARGKSDTLVRNGGSNDNKTPVPRRIPEIVPAKHIRSGSRAVYCALLLAISTGAVVIVFAFEDNLKDLVDFATVLSFMIAPVIAIFNLRLVTGRYMAREDQPSISLRILSFAGIVFLIVFAIFFLFTRFLG